MISQFTALHGGIVFNSEHICFLHLFLIAGYLWKCDCQDRSCGWCNQATLQEIICWCFPPCDSFKVVQFDCVRVNLKISRTGFKERN